MENFKKVFPALQQCTYLNTAYGGLLHEGLLTYRQEHDLDFLIQGSNQRANQPLFFDHVRATISAFTSAAKSDVLLSQNFSLGFRTLFSGLDKSQKVLLIDLDYPSINHTVISLGFETRYAHCNENLEENIKNAITKHQPAILAMSIVNYQNGILVDLGFIKKLKEWYPQLLIIMDATQFLGTRDFDFDNSGIDILGASGYKWMLGGYGNGFFLFKKGVLEKLTPTSYKKAQKNSNYPSSYIDLRARFEPGHLDYFNFGSLQHSLNYLQQLGLPNIATKISAVSLYAKEQLTLLGVLDQNILKREDHSSIFSLKGDQKCYNLLTENTIITAQRGTGIRISLHFYNDKEDIDHLIQVLKKGI